MLVSEADTIVAVVAKMLHPRSVSEIIWLKINLSKVFLVHKAQNINLLNPRLSKSSTSAQPYTQSRTFKQAPPEAASQNRKVAR